MASKGLNWSVNEAQVLVVDQFQNKETGEVMAYVKLQYWGGTTTIMLDPVDAQQFGGLQGKMVKAGGPLSMEIKKGSGIPKITFGLSELTELGKK